MLYSMSLYFGYDDQEPADTPSGGTFDDTKLRGWVLTQIAGVTSSSGLPLAGGQMKGAIDMDNNEIENLGPPGADTSAVSKGWVDTKIAQSGSDPGLSSAGFTMKGDIDMSGHDITGLSNPASGGSAVPKDYVDNNFLTNRGILMEGPVNMNYFEIKNVLNPGHGPLHDKSAISRSYGDTRYLQLSSGTMSVQNVPLNDGYVVNKKYVGDTFVKKTEGATVSGFVTNGPINMNSRDLNGLAPPAFGTSAVSKDYTESRYLLRHGDTVLGELNMGQNALIGLPDTYSDESSAVSKKFVETQFPKRTEVPGTTGFTMSGGISMGGNEILGLPSQPGGPDNAVSKSWVEGNIASAQFLEASGFTMTGDINMSGNEITGLADPTGSTSATSEGYVSNNFMSKLGGTFGGNLRMSQFEILELSWTPSTDRSAVAKGWVQNEINNASYLKASGFDW